MARTSNLSFIGVVRSTDSSILALHIDKEDSLATNEGPTNMQEFGVGQNRHLEQWARGPVFMLGDSNATGLVYCLGAKDAAYPERVAFECLAKLKELVVSKTSSMVRTTGTDGCLNSSIGKDMHSLMSTFDRLDEVDKLSKVNREVDAVKGVMLANIEKLTVQGDSLKDLEDRSTALNESAGQFSAGATQLRRQMQWRNAKVWIIGGVIVAAVVIYLIITFTGGSDKEKKTDVAK